MTLVLRRTLGIAIILAGAPFGCSSNHSVSSFGNPSPLPPDPESGPGEQERPGEFPGTPTSPLDLGFTTSLASAPRPITGGTLLVTNDGSTAIAADSERDLIALVDLDKGVVRTKLALPAGDEPGRAIEDGLARAHVVLRGGGAILDIDLKAGTILSRRAVCTAPRGIAYEQTTDSLHVACATGELITLPAAGGPATRTIQLGRDLRDVVVSGETLMVSRFRSAEILHVAKDGTLTSTEKPPTVAREGGSFAPSTAWRLIAGPNQTAIAVHQRGTSSLLQAKTGGYSGADTCDAAVHSAVTVFGGSAPSTSPVIADAVLPVDIAISPDWKTYAVIAAGNGHSPSLQQLYRLPANAPITDPAVPCMRIPQGEQPSGQATAVAFVDAGRIAVQLREPASVVILQDGKGQVIIPLSSDTREDTGHAILHSNAGAGVACASCHAEGGDDGRTWQFEGGDRRTPSLRGTLAGTAPYHWDGDMQDITQLAHEVFSTRMSGPELQSDQSDALRTWLYALPAPASSPGDTAVAQRGKALFDDSAVGCSGCHAGAMLTSNATVDVGTGGTFQVPSLIGLAWRAPYLHSGCAQTLADRFDPEGCGGADQHGRTSQLSQAQIADLISYLETL